MTFRFADKIVFGLLFAAGFLLLTSLVLFNFGTTLAFYLLSITLLASATGVVLLRDVIRSAFLLALSFLCVGGLYVTLHADFLAAAQILIYAGAVSILFVFGIMLIRNGGKNLQEYGADFRGLAGIFVFLGLFSLLAQTVWKGQWHLEGSTTPADLNTVAEIGKLFFNQYLIPFEIASVILLMALVGAIVIARKEVASENGQ
ncbi:NADH:ubiquinone oxidoreductase subunit J [bacterium (Candidatus Blackallbacteria) CG17_big_fil_post_rev_8_21_14_2_50_48_46]|uniref:NADH-quinone oxidoreductase subunit J n=1 Tax=bacterium (Candidatus Blackallbacteria) CG17_big_fil_post_rev_8_21_14_2_50_48_46 TaxID=2014261 RepID=A0A2M7FY24_9BACT|nr:MAG: NADH:ubiquinone oxidoreductase subunit J [bacterium (Candidatus Blackallbacteria) CG18_big_fil_WC_8_21_14_2_50_49_26]PIW14019.1 MAG: NADH:ubiquinone oxidoreductase subunit J [bacterium (Candidatus Blackallbacteria) CG17_big_fil_post_rev_8_21_14_2_50_48_46]PIW46871.1 MAG: NADH:ubiquinone oxidoreductase subunit J [bacterium (Candidatus Blackallbacteria) CG13_big_fil_rev_8_21_14_2_50_49_14]